VAQADSCDIAPTEEYDAPVGSRGGTATPAADASIVYADDLSSVFDAYRDAVNEEQLALKHRGHVTSVIRERLRALRDELRASLDEPHGEAAAEVRRRLRLLAELESRLHHIAEQDVESRSAELVRIHESLVRLRKLSSPQELPQRAPAGGAGVVDAATPRHGVEFAELAPFVGVIAEAIAVIPNRARAPSHLRSTSVIGGLIFAIAAPPTHQARVLVFQTDSRLTP